MFNRGLNICVYKIYISLERHGHRSDDTLFRKVLREKGDDAVVVLLAQVDVNLLQHARHLYIRWIRLLHRTELITECCGIRSPCIFINCSILEKKDKNL